MFDRFHALLRPSRLAAVLGLGLGLALSSLAQAADAPGCKDLNDLKRFEGSSIVFCDKRDFAEYTLVNGRFEGYDFNAHKPLGASVTEVEGRLNQLVYAVPVGPSSAEVFRNYKLDLEAKGFAISFEAKGADIGRGHGSFFQDFGPGGQIFGYSEQFARYAVASKEVDGVKIWAVLYIVDFQGGYNPKFAPAKGQVMVRLDFLQIGELKDRMVLVSAAEMVKGLNANGKIALYGIQFDFNKASLKPESKPTIDEIGRMLRDEPARKLYVVGHTDNVGGFDFNMQLSAARANAVVAELVKAHGIAAGRLKAAGVGLLAPVAANDAEEGRARNRRVELLAQ